MPLAPFTVRGRWDAASPLTVRVDPQGSPLDGEAFRATVERALSEWEGIGPLAFRLEAAAEPADITFAWRRGAHDACEPFGISHARAHAGPVRPGTFVHFDADREWYAAGLHRVALHEIGHLLGLGHSEAAGSLLLADPPDSLDSITRWERYGIQSLYGGGEDQAGDLRIVSVDGAEMLDLAPALRQVAPPGRSAVAVFDTDGDGDDEVLVWRTDPQGQGTVLAYHFEAGPRLARTTGPMVGRVVPEWEVWPVALDSGERLLVSSAGDGRRVTLAFDDRGLLGPGPDASVPAVPPPALGDSGDLDGDGRIERVLPVR